MVGWALLAFFVAVPLAEPFGFNERGRFAALLAALVVVWSVLAVAAIVLALRHARAARDLLRFAWCAVAAPLVLAMPMAVALLAEHEYTEEPGTTCSPGLIPEAVVRALFGWIPWPAYVWTPAVTGLAGLVFLLPAPTRRPGAWILAGTLMGLSLALSGLVMIVNQCD